LGRRGSHPDPSRPGRRGVNQFQTSTSCSSVGRHRQRDTSSTSSPRAPVSARESRYNFRFRFPHSHSAAMGRRRHRSRSRHLRMQPGSIGLSALVFPVKVSSCCDLQDRDGIRRWALVCSRSSICSASRWLAVFAMEDGRSVPMLLGICGQSSNRWLKRVSRQASRDESLAVIPLLCR